jgi:hypothetical protein
MADSGKGAVSQKGSRAFVTRHDQLFTTIGALIVFIGFYLKEGIQEKTKDSISALSAAQASFRIEKQLNDIRHALHPLSRSDVYVDELLPHPKNAHMRARLAEVEKKQADVVVMSGVLLDRMELANSMLIKIPNLSAEMRRSDGEMFLSIKKESECINAFHDELNKVSITVPTAHSPDLKPEDELRQLKGELKQLHDMDANINAHFEACDISIWKLGLKMGEFERKVLKEAEDQTLLNEKKLGRITVVSYCLFFVGWSLGLAGKLFKLPALGGSGLSD